MTAAKLGVVVLAAGRGTRMRSSLPKALHPVCGSPMAAHVIAAAQQLHPHKVVVVVGHKGDQVRDALGPLGVAFVTQPKLLGTADAVRCAEPELSGCGRVLVLNGDAPLVTAALLRDLLSAAARADMAFVTCEVDEAGRLGRVLRDGAGRVEGIVEAADDKVERGRAEINAGQYAFAAQWLWPALANVHSSPGGEYYLTDLPAQAYRTGRPAATVLARRELALGVDDRVTLAEAERLMRDRTVRRHMENGVTLLDPGTAYIDSTVEIAADATIFPNCYLYGQSSVGARTQLGPGTTLVNSSIGVDCVVRFSVVEDSAVGSRVTIGPFAHLRGGARIGDDCELGNYAEVKNSNIGAGVKMHHFSYAGDADVGAGTNLAAGMITCNFDGVAKHRTTIGERVFVGCDTMLVAPVAIGDGAMTAAGAVVTKDVPAGGRVAGVPARPMQPSTEKPDPDGR